VFTTKPSAEKDFDVFSRAHEAQWTYKGRIRATSPEEAKESFMQENFVTNPNNVAVYVRR